MKPACWCNCIHNTYTVNADWTQAIGHCALRLDRNVLFTTQTRMLGILHAAKATTTYERRLRALTKVDLLIIDDFGLEPLQSQQDEDLYTVIAEGY